jgi:hypothetical protein
MEAPAAKARESHSLAAWLTSARTHSPDAIGSRATGEQCAAIHGCVSALDAIITITTECSEIFEKQAPNIPKRKQGIDYLHLTIFCQNKFDVSSFCMNKFEFTIR